MPGPAIGTAAAGRRSVLTGRAQRRAAEVVRQLPAEAHFTAEIGLGFQVADRSAVVADGVPTPAVGIDAGIARPAAHALMGQHEQRLVVQLVVPALEFLVAQHFVHGILHLLALCPRANHAQRQLGGLQAVAAARIETEVCDQYAGVRAVVLDQVPAAEIGRGEDALADAEDHVLLFELARMQPFQVLVHPAGHAWQAGVVGVIDQIGRDQGQQCTIGIALVLVAAAEQVVVNAEIDLRRVVAHRVRATLFGRLGGEGEGSSQQAGQPEGCKAALGRGAHVEVFSVCRYMPRHGTRAGVMERARSNHLSVPKTTLSREDNPALSCGAPRATANAERPFSCNAATHRCTV